MSELYDVVKRVVDASSMEEADELLYGENGIIISNSKEYYQNLVSTFIFSTSIFPVFFMVCNIA